jgi:hypothetical protein
MLRESHPPVRDHVRILAILNIVVGGIGLLVGAAFLLMFGGIGILAGAANSGDPDAALAFPILGAIGGIIFFALLLFSAPQIIGGVGLLKMQPWARILMIVVSALGLLSIPIGTALGIYGLWVLLNEETVRLFSVPGQLNSPQPPTSEYPSS